MESSRPMDAGIMAQLVGGQNGISKGKLLNMFLNLYDKYMDLEKKYEDLKQKVSQGQEMKNSGTTLDEISPNSQLGIKEADQNPGNVLNIDNNITRILKYCSDPNKCKTIVQMLMECNSAKALKEAILSIDESGSMIDIDTMDTLLFCRDIIPLINYKTNETALKQVIHRLKQKNYIYKR